MEEYGKVHREREFCGTLCRCGLFERKEGTQNDETVRGNDFGNREGGGAKRGQELPVR